VIVDAVTFKSKWTFVALEQMSAYSRLSIYFKFKTLSANGLILLNAGKESHFVAVEIVNGHIVYSFNLGDGARRLSSRSKNLNDNKWHAVTILRSIFNHHSLRVDDQVDNLTSTGVSSHLVLQGLLYFGGVPSEMYSELPNAVRSRNGFEGCFANIEFNHKVIDPMNPDQVVIGSTLVSRGCSYASFLSPSPFVQEQRCPLDTCHRRGVCVEYSANQFACDCDQSSFTGSSCSEEGVSFRFGHMSSDMNSSPSSSSPSPGIASSGGLVTVNFPDGLQIDTKSDSLTFGIITKQENSVILRVDSGTTSDYMEMQLVAGKILIVYNLGTDDHSIADSRVSVADNRYHVIRFTRSGPNSTLQIDHHNPVSRALSGRKQMAIFDTLSKIQIGSRSGAKDLPPPASRSPNPFRGIISGLTFNGMMILDLAAEGDERITTAGDVVLVPELPKRFNPNNMNSLMGNESHTRTEDPRDFRLDEDLDDDLILSHEEYPHFCWADHQCRTLLSSPDDLITSFVTDTTSSTTAISGFITPSSVPAVVCEQDEDDEDCSEGSGDAEEDDEDEGPVVVVATPKVNPDVTFDERFTTSSTTTTSTSSLLLTTYATSDVFEFMMPTTSSSTTTSTTEATRTTTRRLPKTTAYIDPKDLEQSYRPRSTSSHPSYPKNRPEINEVPRPMMKKPGFYGATTDNNSNNRPVPVGKDKDNQHHVSKSFTSVDRTALAIGIIATIIIVIVFVAPILLFARLRMMDPSALPSSHMTGHQMIFSQSGLGSSLQGCKTMAHFAPALPPASTMLVPDSAGALIDAPPATHPQLHNQLHHHHHHMQQRSSGSLIPNPGPTSILKKKRDPSLEWYV
jgi:leucine-rich repeat transmembrane neuronal protein 1/2